MHTLCHIPQKVLRNFKKKNSKCHYEGIKDMKERPLPYYLCQSHGELDLRIGKNQHSRAHIKYAQNEFYFCYSLVSA